jgi:hypothetical protein
VITAPPGRLRLLFTPGARLGWVFRDRRALVAPYPEPPPDPEIVRRQCAVRAAAAERSYQLARAWVARPALMLAITTGVLAGCAKAVSPGSDVAGTFLIALLVGASGVAFAWWRRTQRDQAAVDPGWVFEQARRDWAGRAAAHQESSLAQLATVPEWGSADPPARRTDVFGGNLEGWRSLLAVHGTSILAAQPLLVADLSGQNAAATLAGFARQAGVPGAEYSLPGDLGRCGLLARLTAGQLADALAEAIHAGAPGGARADRAVDVRVLEQVIAVLKPGGVTPVRLAAAVQVALGHPAVGGLLADTEAGLIRGTLFPDGYRGQITANLIRLDAFLADLAVHAGSAPAGVPAPAWYTCLAVEPGARTARAEVLTALVIQWLTVQVTSVNASTPAVIIAGADEITRAHLERLSDACERRGVHLTLLFRHLRDESVGMMGGGSVAFMRLGNHHEAEQAASFLGRQHRFVLSGFTATYGMNQSRADSLGYSHGTSQSRGQSDTQSRTDDLLLDPAMSGSRTTSRDRSVNQGWNSSASWTEGTSWSDAASVQRVYEYIVEPGVLQNLPENALLVAGHGGIGLRAVECHPAIITMPGVSTRPFGPLPERGQAPVGGVPEWPQIQPRQHQPQWTPTGTNALETQPHPPRHRRPDQR